MLIMHPFQECLAFPQLRNRMNRFQHIVIILLLTIQPVQEGFAQKADSSSLWLGETAFTMPKGEIQFGLFQPLRTGLSPTVELLVHPVLLIMDPNAGVKLRLHASDNFIISSEHSLYFPTPMLRLFQMRGAGGIISSQFSIPVLITMYNGIIISRYLNFNSILSLEAGFYFTLGASKLDNNSSIDLPVIYPRLESLYHQPELLLGLNVNSEFVHHFNYLMGARAYIIPGVKENLFAEQSGMIQWRPGSHFMLQGGYKLCYGRYSFGPEWNLIPDFDLVFHFHSKKFPKK